MKLKGMLLASLAVLVLTSGAANAGGKEVIAEWLLARLGLMAERSAVEPRIVARDPMQPEIDSAKGRMHPEIASPVFRSTESTTWLGDDTDLYFKGRVTLDDYQNYLERKFWTPRNSQLAASAGEARSALRGGGFKTQNNLESQLSKVSSLYEEATPQIVADLNSDGALTQQQLEEIINAAVKKNIEHAAEVKKSGLAFEALTGKLTIEWSYTGRFGKLSAGDINLYKVGGIVASDVIACKALGKTLDQPECIKAALAGAKKIALDELKIATADSKETKSGLDIPQ